MAYRKSRRSGGNRKRGVRSKSYGRKTGRGRTGRSSGRQQTVKLVIQHVGASAAQPVIGQQVTSASKAAF